MSSQAQDPAVYRSVGQDGKLHARRDCWYLDRAYKTVEKRLSMFPTAVEYPGLCKNCCPEGWFE